MAERRISWKWKLAGIGSGLVAVAGGAYFVVDSQAGGGHDQPSAIIGNVLDLTPTPTATPFIFESPHVSLAPTEIATPVLTAALAETVSSSDKGGLETVVTPTATARPVWTAAPLPFPVVISAPTPEPTIVPTPEATQVPEGLNYEAARIVVDKINNARAENGLVLLVDNSSLVAAAQKYAQFLVVNRQSLDHCNDGSPQERGEREGYVGGVGEILVAGDSPEIMFERLMGSPNHRAAILNPDIRDIGFGYYKGQFGSAGAGELGIPSIESWHTC